MLNVLGMVSNLLGGAGLSALNYLKYLLPFAVVVGAFYYGQHVNQLACDAARHEEMAHLAQQNAHDLHLAQQQLFDVEQAWLDTSDQIKLVYKDRVTKVIEHVQTSSNTGGHDCRLDHFGVQLVNQALSNAP